MEEGVDGLDAEVVVVVEEVSQSDASPLADKGRLEARLLADGLEVAVRVGQLFPDAVELAEDAHLHLLGGLVGEGDGEDAAIAEWVFHEQANILGCECEGLAAACAGFVDCQGFYHRLKSSKSHAMPKLWKLMLWKLAKIPTEM